MCLPFLIFEVIGALSTLCSFVWLVMLPACAIIFGAPAFSSLSIAISISMVTGQLLPDFFKKCIPFLELAVTLSALIFPLVYIPRWVSEVNLTLQAFLDPLFLVLEVFQMLSIVRWCNAKAQVGIDALPLMWKALVLCFTVASWVFSLFLLVHLFQVEDKRLTMALLVLNVVAHAACIYVDQGIISDAALVLVVSLLLLRLGPAETGMNETLCSAVQSNHPELGAGTLLAMLTSLPNLTSVALTRTVSALRSLTTPLFWIGVIVRVGLVMPSLVEFFSLGGRKDAACLFLHLPARGAVMALFLVTYTQALWRHLLGCHWVSVPPTRPMQSLLLVLGYTVQLFWAGGSRDGGNEW